MEENFKQNAAAKLDILWVIDNSGSMSTIQTSLRNNIASFIGALDTKRLDVQIGITSTDVCPGQSALQPLEEAVCPVHDSNAIGLRGSLIGDSGRRVIRGRDTDRVQRFKRYANLGVNGSSFEHGLTAASMAVDKSMHGQNEELVREDAHLAVIVVSDEEDDGVGLSRPDEEGVNYWAAGKSRYIFNADMMVKSLETWKGRSQFSVSAIVGTPDSNGRPCTSTHGRAVEVGQEYLRAAELTGGVQASICAANWSRTLSDLGQDLLSQIESISLRAVPQVASIQVRVNGVLERRWQYIPGKNAVKFDPKAVPAPGADIKISYMTFE